MDGWKFIRLVQAMRQASVSISSQDIQDAQTCLQRYPYLSEKLITRSILIHRPQDYSIFETVWRIIIEDLTSSERGSEENDRKEMIIENQDSSIGIGGQGVGRGYGGISLTQKGPIVDAVEVSRQIPASRIEELISSGNQFEDCFKAILANIDYYSWINSYDLAYQRGQLIEEEWYQHQNSRDCLLQEIRQLLISVQVTQENSWEPLVRQHWMFKSLSSLTESEKALVKSSIRKWARKLAIRPGFHWVKSRQGTVDITQIVRQSVQWNGVLFRLCFRRRKLRAAELVVLCDISNSMASFVEFLIYLVTCLRDRFRKVRVFFFIDSIWDITNFIWDDDQSFKQEIQSWGHKVSSGFSDYGAVFKEFATKILTDVTARATVVILGDAKNNYRPAQTEYLAQISEHVRKVVWLNPLDTVEWSERDNQMKDYQKYCSKVYRCRSANDLQKVVRDFL
ncbi:MAG: VWA domain-containing protein [Bacillota bacterium]|nr:VWA domain-containing protein [Bacillota bacterium]